MKPYALYLAGLLALAAAVPSSSPDNEKRGENDIPLPPLPPGAKEGAKPVVWYKMDPPEDAKEKPESYKKPEPYKHEPYKPKPYGEDKKPYGYDDKKKPPFYPEDKKVFDIKDLFGKEKPKEEPKPKPFPDEHNIPVVEVSQVDSPLPKKPSPPQPPKKDVSTAEVDLPVIEVATVAPSPEHIGEIKGKPCDVCKKDKKKPCPPECKEKPKPYPKPKPKPKPCDVCKEDKKKPCPPECKEPPKPCDVCKEDKEKPCPPECNKEEEKPCPDCEKCQPGTYSCTEDPKTGVPGWKVCDVTGLWVFAGDCPPETVCKFYEPSKSPYCVPFDFQFPRC